MSYQYIGQCRCGRVKLEFTLPGPLAQFSPRLCDCDFCTARNIAYLSHPEGEIRIASDQPLHRYRQGSNQAEFLACSQCDTVMGVTAELAGSHKGAVNANQLEKAGQLQQATVVSPKQLGAEEKLARWQQLWSTVTINDQASPK